MSHQISKSQINQQIKSLNSILSSVTQCVNKKVTDPKKLQTFKSTFKSTQPKCLKGGQLKPYQKQALTWMIQLSFKHMNGILADDMGLGKTIQTISYFAYLKQQYGIKGKHIIICPLTVINNWKREINKWLPQLNVQILWATFQQRQKGLIQILKPRKFDILITSYQGAVSSLKQLSKITFETLIIDEAHKIKNDQAIITQSIKVLRSNFKLLLTGTPLSNNLRELWSLLNFIMPQIFYDRDVFDKIQDGVKFYQGTEEEKFQIQCNIARKFHSIIRPFILRRTKKDTDLGLPTKTQHTLFVSMTKLQLQMYKNFLKYRSIWGKGGNRTDNSQMTTRKICNHPYLIQGVQQQGLPELGEHLIENCGKMIVLDKLLEKIVKKQKQKVLIFSQFKIQMNILQDYLTYRDINYFRLDGDSSIQQRQIMMQKFNNDKQFNFPVFILSTRAGGLGINLVAASVVIIYDIDWNPQNDNQAMDRAYRIGQTKPVRVYKLITQHTIQQRMLQIQKYKLIWDQLVIQKGAIMNIKNQDILQGLNYQKIANMKKGEIFKIQAIKQSKTIDQIIKIGQQKDQDKYKLIKQKIMKQIQEQKKNQNFSANPFDQNQYQDKQGKQKMAKYQQQNNLLKKRVQVVQNRDYLKENKAKIRKKHQFISSVNLPEYHMYENPEKIKEIMFQIQMIKLDIEEINHSLKYQQDEDGSIQAKLFLEEQKLQRYQHQLKQLKKQSFQKWSEEEFQIFVDQEKLEHNEKVDNIKKLRQKLPNKSIKQIKAFKQAFYKLTFENLKRMLKIRNNILKTQKQSKLNHDKKYFHQNIKKNQAILIKKGFPINHTLNSLLNNMRISSGLHDPGDFLQSSQFIQDRNLNQIRKIFGEIKFQKKAKQSILHSHNLLRKFYNTNMYEHVLKNTLSKEELQKEFYQCKSKVIEDVRRKIFKEKNNKDKNQKVEEKQDLII